MYFAASSYNGGNKMFDRTTGSKFQNRQHVGEFTDISFDIALDDKGEEVETIEASLHFLKFGQGEPMILLHGLGQSMYPWRKCFWMLEESFTCYAIDLPGHGCSEKAGMAYAVEDFSLTLESFMMKKEIESAHIVTFGETAAYALDFAEQCPDKVKSLMLVSPMMERDNPKGKCFSPFAAASSRFLFSKKGFAQDLESWFFDTTLVDDSIINEYFIPFEDKEMRQILKIADQNYNDIEVKERILDITAPILIIRGSDDRLSPEIAQGFGGLPQLKAKAFTVRNCGWLVQEEKPDKLCAAISRFVELVDQQ